MNIEDKAYFLFDTPGMSQKEKDKRAKYWLALEKQQAKKAMEDWRFAVAQEERYMGSVFVTPGRQREMEARTQAAYLKAKKLNPDYQGFSMPVEDKAYFDRRIEVETWKSPKGTTLIAGLDQGSSGLFQPFITATYLDGGQQLMTMNPPKFKTEGGARKWLSAEITRRKTPNARQGYKAKFANEEIAKRLSQVLKANGFDEMAFTILQLSTDSDMLRKYIRFLKSKILPMNNNEREMILLKTLEKQLASRTGTKTKFANRGAFAEASSSPVLGSLLEKKVMPEGGWRAVETDGGALVIAFEDGDIAGNFARRASENGYSATAPMAMAGRFWNVKVQNENKN